MRLLNCHIYNFGCLSEERFSFDEGITMLSRRNGSGKSTLADFLLVMFYGFADETKRDSEKRQRERYRPWQGGIYGGELVFAAGDGRYRMTRTFGRTPSEDRFSLINEDTRLPAGNFSGQIGRELFGVDRESFLRTAFAGQLQSYRPGRTDDMNARLGGISADEDDLTRYEAARETLRRWLNQNSPSRKTGRINALRRQLDGLKSLSQELADAEREAGVYQADMAGREQLIQENEGRLRTLLAEQRSLAARQDRQLQQERRRGLCLRETEAREQLLQARRVFPDPDNMPRAEKIDELLLLVQKELIPAQTILSLAEQVPSPLSQQSVSPPQRGDKKLLSAALPALLLLIIFFAGAGGIYFKFPELRLLSAFLALCGIGFAALIFFLYRRFDKKKSSKAARHESDLEQMRDANRIDRDAGRQAERKVKLITRIAENYLQSVGFSMPEDLPGMLTQLRDALRREQLCAEQWQRASEALAQFDAVQTKEASASVADKVMLSGGTPTAEKAPKTMTELQDEIEKLRRSLRMQEQAQEQTREALTEALERRDRLEAARQEKQRLEQLIAGQEEDYRLVLRTEELLREAKEALTASYTEPVLKRVLHYYGAGDALTMDANGQPAISACGHARSADFLSTGQRDLLGLCLRAAQLDVMYPDEKPFLVLDDPFVNLDRENRQRAEAVLGELARRYQILYLTCAEELP